MDLWHELTEIFQKVFSDPEISLDRSTQAGALPGWDSLAHVRLIIEIEKHFQISLTPRESTTLKDVGELIDLIELRLSTKE